MSRTRSGRKLTAGRPARRPSRIGVFGGSFDPVHNGHLHVAHAAADSLDLDCVVFVPAAEQPFKAGQHGASAADRLAMLRAATADEPRFAVDDREIRRGGRSYTIDTVRELRAEHPADELFLLVGADAAAELPAWRDVESLPGLITIVSLPRPGATLPEHPLIRRAVPVSAIDVSATEIRERCRAGQPIDDLVPTRVAEIIRDRGLYTEGD